MTRSEALCAEDDAALRARLRKIMEELSAQPKGCPAGVVDLRDLAAPEPLERALLLAAALRPGEHAIVCTPRVPMLLLTRLRERAYRFAVESAADGSALVYIERP